MSEADFSSTRAKTKKYPTLTSKKYRTKFVDSIRNVVEINEIYHKKLEELLFHAFHRKFISTRVAIKGFRELVTS